MPYKINFYDEDADGNPTGAFHPKLSIQGMEPGKIVKGNIDLGVYTTGGFDVSKISGLFDIDREIYVPPFGGYLFEHDKENDKLIVRYAASSHVHTVDLDQGATGVPSATETKEVQVSTNLLYGFLAAPTASATKYLGTNGEEEAALVAAPWINGPDCDVIALRVYCATAPGAGKEYTLELYVNGAASGASVTISGTEDTGTWAGATPISLNQGDMLSFKSVNDDGAIANVSFTLVCAMTTTVSEVPTATHTHVFGTLGATTTGAGGTSAVATEVANGTDLSELVGIPFFAIGR